MNDKNHPSDHKHVRGYEQLLQQVKDLIHESEDEISSRFHHALDSAKKTVAQLNDYTKEELDLIGEYIRRDIHDAAHFLSETGEEFSDWLRFDTQLVEARLLELMSLAVDSSRVELAELTRQTRRESIWNSGETTGPGTLQCKNCKHLIRFTQTSQIKPCPECGHEQFQRPEE